MPNNDTGTIDPVTGQLSGQPGPTGTAYYGTAPKDAQGRSYVVWPDGSKFYLRPQDASAGGNGGMIHNPDNWNPKTGQWEPGGVDWAKLGAWLGLAAIGGGVTAAALASSAPAAVTASTGVTGTAGGGTAATGGTLAATQTVPTTGVLATGGTASGAVPTALSAGGTTAASTGGTVGGSTVATKGLGSLGWASLIGNVGTNVLGSYLSNRANNKAIDAESAASKEALDFAKQAYADRMGLLTPYREFGARALSTLGDLTGNDAPPVNMPQMATDRNRVQSGQPFPASWVSGSPLSGIGQTAPGAGTPVSQTGVITIQAPDGSRRQVPASLEAFYVARNGKVVA